MNELCIITSFPWYKKGRRKKQEEETAFYRTELRHINPDKFGN